MKDAEITRIILAYDKTPQAKQSEAITTHQMVTSVLIAPLAQAAESQASTSTFTNIAKQP